MFYDITNSCNKLSTLFYIHMKDFPSRLRAVRTGLLKLSQLGFSERIGVAEVTVRAWETGKSRITSNFLDKLVTELSKLEIPISKEWLLDGSGISPFDKSILDNKKISEKDIFISLNPGAILLEIKDESYEPVYKKGDLVGGFPILSSQAVPMSYVLVDIDGGKTEIRQTIFTQENEIILLPIHLRKESQALIFKPTMQLYQIIWFKSQKLPIS